MIELLKQNLAIEPDLQNFLGFVLMAAKSLGGNPFAASLASLELASALRNAGAGTGYPLPVKLMLDNNMLTVHWNDGATTKIVGLESPPAPDAIEQLHLHLQQSTETADPELLLQRNAEMTRFLNETRERTEKEIEAMQQALEKRQEELRDSLRQAETDPLTGLLNRRAYDERLDHAFRRILRQKNEALTLILFDLDFFKEINDQYGHQFGDAYLNKMAHAMGAVIRHEVDFAFRFGGDEFAILLFCDKERARDKALEVLASMENKVSIGIASVSPDEPCNGDLQQFIRRADNALYEAKRSGRGRVVVDTCGPDGTISWQHFQPVPSATVPA